MTVHPALDWWTELRRIQAAIHRLFEQVLGPQGKVPLFYPDVNVRVAPTYVEIIADLPGVRPEELKVYWEGQALVIEGVKRPPHGDEEGVRVLRLERPFGPFYRTVPIPWAVNPHGASAALQNGWLVVRLPRIQDRRVRRIDISVQERVTGNE
jgi:HSP20 family protein